MELEAFLQPYPLEVQQTFLEGREFLLKMLSPAVELVFDATSAVCCGFCYTGKTNDNFVNLAAFANHVTLVFASGANLEDPQGLLKGEGSRVRHIRLRGASDLAEPPILQLIQQAAEKAPKPSGPVEPKVVVKVYAGPKRRPKSIQTIPS